MEKEKVLLVDLPKDKSCNICGGQYANNLTWSSEWVCDSCVEWISESKLKNVLDEREKEREFDSFWMTFCNKEKLEFDICYAGLEIAKKDLDYYSRNSLWVLVDEIKRKAI